MFEHRKIAKLDDFFVNLQDRPGRGVYFYRINAYNDDLSNFIRKYYEFARTTGVVIEGRIPNPDEKNLSYYGEIMGMDFRMDLEFIASGLKKWLPRMNEYQRKNVATSIYDTLDTLRKAGKNENMLKNAYIKFMCWLYYRFERIVNLLGENKVPKILYEGEITNYELLLVKVLSNAGCDVVLLQYRGDEEYLKLDPTSTVSDPLNMTVMNPFPENFSLKWMREQIQNEYNIERLYGEKPSVSNCTNAWIEGRPLEDIRRNSVLRGTDYHLFYNCFFRVNGAWDKMTYVNDLYQLYLEMKNNKRQILVVDDAIPQPTNDEIAKVRRGNYAKEDQMLKDISGNIRYTPNLELQRIMVKGFMDIMLEESKQPGMNLNKLTNKAVYLICWLNRYQSSLFHNWKMPEIGCFIHMGPVKSANEAMFVRFLAKLPVDVLILNPALNGTCEVRDRVLYEENYDTAVNITRFPAESTDVRMGTVAYHAERELDSLMYGNTGLYRTGQFDKANPFTLQTMYEEIAQLWNEELKYRPNFSTTEDVVSFPVIFAKVSGVKEGDVDAYWSGIKQLMVEDTFVVDRIPFVEHNAPNPIRQYATEFFKNGKLQKSKIKAHPAYPYSFLRVEIQDHMLDKLQKLIDDRIISGTFENGTEYTIVSVALNLSKGMLRLIQKFDFTRNNPKLIYLDVSEKIGSLEDAILFAFLNYIGFDVVFFVPTGYQSVEKYYSQRIIEEHLIGDFVYDLSIPDFSKISTKSKGRGSGFFRRG